MILAQAYNIHRHLHENNPHRRMTDYQFKISVVKGLLEHPIVREVNQQHNNQYGNHEMMQYPVGW